MGRAFGLPALSLMGLDWDEQRTVVGLLHPDQKASLTSWTDFASEDERWEQFEE